MAVAAAGWVGVGSPGDYAARQFLPLPRHDQSAAAIKSFETRTRKEAITKATEIAKAAGFASLEDMMAAQPGNAGKAEPKYRHPENPDLTWTGRGRKPGWIGEALEAGKSLDDFVI
nr:H-NS histone family protein [Paracoccus shandongensis]